MYKTTFIYILILCTKQLVSCYSAISIIFIRKDNVHKIHMMNYTYNYLLKYIKNVQF